MDEDQLTYDPENGQCNFPVAILMETDGTDGRSRAPRAAKPISTWLFSTTEGHYQSQLSICTLDKPLDNGYTIKVLKQKLWVSPLSLLPLL